MSTPAAPATPDARETFLAVCTRCGGRNRVSRARLDQQPRCGRCQEELLPRQPVTVTDATFGDEVERWPQPVLVDFWAPWCGPCRVVAPVLDKLAGERAGHLKIAKVNVDENPRLAARFAIQAIPAMMLFRDGKMVEEIRGAVPKAALEARLAPHL
jgi:thioredoxin 2